MLYSCLTEKERTISICEDRISQEELPMLRTPPPLAAVNIMQGCDNFCTYCIVPFVRGREHSRAMESILSEIKAIQKQGYREVMLLGQNVNSYGKGWEGTNFPALLDAVAQTGIERIRFMTSHPKDVSQELMEQIAHHPNICKQLHLPVQSGSTEILRRMNRKYTREEYLGLIDQIRRIVPGIALSTDVMVGFPGETEKDFLETYTLLKELSFDSVFTFKYSKRKGTKAAEFEDQVPIGTKTERIMRLIDLQSEITYRSNLAYVGRKERILVEGISTRSKTNICGRTDSGKMVNVEGSDALIGGFVTVEIIGAKKNLASRENCICKYAVYSLTIYPPPRNCGSTHFRRIWVLLRIFILERYFQMIHIWVCLNRTV